MNKTIERIDWIDLCKFFGIFSVVLGHAGTSNYINNYIHAFHMPIFFLLSGYCFNNEKYSSILFLIKNRFKTLLVPYFLFGIILFYFWNFSALFLNRAEDIKSSMTLLSSMFWVNTQATTFGVIQWFLTCLFFTEIIYWLILKLTKKNIYYLVLILFIISAIAYSYPLFIAKRLPLAIDVALSAVVFYGIGWLCKTYFSSLYLIGFRKLGIYNYAIIILCTAVVSLYTVYINGATNMRTLTYSNYFLFYFNSIIITSVIIFTSLLLKLTINGAKIYEWMIYIGKNTIIILVLNSTFIKIFDVIISLSVNKFVPYGNNAMSVVVALAVLFTLTPVCFVINNYIPFVLGRRRQN